MWNFVGVGGLPNLSDVALLSVPVGVRSPLSLPWWAELCQCWALSPGVLLSAVWVLICCMHQCSWRVVSERTLAVQEQLFREAFQWSCPSFPLLQLAYCFCLTASELFHDSRYIASVIWQISRHLCCKHVSIHLMLDLLYHPLWLYFSFLSEMIFLHPWLSPFLCTGKKLPDT